MGLALLALVTPCTALALCPTAPVANFAMEQQAQQHCPSQNESGSPIRWQQYEPKIGGNGPVEQYQIEMFLNMTNNRTRAGKAFFDEVAYANMLNSSAVMRGEVEAGNMRHPYYAYRIRFDKGWYTVHAFNGPLREKVSYVDFFIPTVLGSKGPLNDGIALLQSQIEGGADGSFYQVSDRILPSPKGP